MQSRHIAVVSPMLALWALLVPVLVAADAADKPSPISKVVELLSGLEAKVTKDGEAELKAYNEYTAYCRKESADKNYEIKTGKAKIEELKAAIAKATGDISAANSRVQELTTAIATSEGDLKAATDIRNKEQADFQQSEKDILDSIDTLGRAVTTLTAEAAKDKKGTSLLQVGAKNSQEDVLKALSTVLEAASLPLSDRKALLALTQDFASGSLTDAQKPEAEAYKKRSGGVLELLKDLTDKAKKQLVEARKQDASSLHNFMLLQQSLKNQAAAADKELKEKTAFASASAEAKATAEGDLAGTQKELAEDEASLATLTASCQAAEEDHKFSVQGRAEELKALAAAKQVVLEKTKGATAKVYKTLLLQADSRHMVVRPDAFEVAEMVRTMATKDSSAALMQLATRLDAVIRFGAESGQDPFAKVRALIAGLLEKLKAEEKAEDTHKAYCDKELKTTKAKTDELTNVKNGLTAKADQESARSATLKNEVQTLQAQLAEMAKAELKLDQIRKDESAAFAETKQTLTEGLDGVRSALRVLRDYYAGTAANAAFVQAPPRPGAYKKDSATSSGIISVLEVVETDFGRSLVQAETDEAAKQEDYEKIKKQNELDKTTKKADVEYKTKTFKAVDEAVAQLITDNQANQAELDAVLEYKKSLDQTCTPKIESYEERKAKRESELAGLQNALTILNGETSFLQQQSKGLRRGVRGRRL